MLRARIFGEWFPEAVSLEAVEAVRKIDPVLADCMEGSAEYEPKED